MKKVYKVTYRSSEKNAVKVFASNEEEAKKAAFAAYTFRGSMWYPNPPLDRVVEKAELDPDQTMRGTDIQPSVQADYVPPTHAEILAEQFPEKEG